jgi:hypothetical protein
VVIAAVSATPRLTGAAGARTSLFTSAIIISFGALMNGAPGHTGSEDR